MGEFFQSFEDAWAYFRAREEPLEDFFAGVPPGGVTAEAWFVMVGGAIREEAQGLKRALAPIEWVVPVPDEFLHVTLAASTPSNNLPLGVAPFEIEVGRVNCFHDAVVAEVTGVPGAVIRAIAPEHDLSTFLPHVTLGVFRGEHPPGPLKDLLVPLRDRSLGRQRVTELARCRVGVGTGETLISGWDVLETRALG